jgi:ABC-type lipoprotein release transport system permease subunit
MLYLKIAWRSLLRHRAKSIIIGTILFLASLIMIIGDATAIGMRQGVEKNIVESFTGHIILVSDEEPKDNVLFTPMAKPLKILKDWEKIKWVLSQQDFVKDFIPMTRGGVAILGGQGMNFMLTFGCNFEDFQRVFGNPVRPVEGQLLTGADHGMLVNVDGRERLYKTQGYWLIPTGAAPDAATLTEDAKKEGSKLITRESLALEGFGEPNSTNKDVPVKGVVKFRSLNSSLQEITFLDIETYREIFGYYTARDIVQTLPAREQQLMSASEDDLFGGGIYSSGAPAGSIGDLEKTIKTQTIVTRTIDFDNAAWNYVSILLRPGENLNAAVARMKQLAKENDLPVKVLSWKQASGQVASTADLLQSVVVVFVVLLFFVAIIIIMNTLSMNALERTEEFGMMRAVGARKGFITRMFLAETFSLSVVFGGGGILLGEIAAVILRNLHLGSGGNQIMELIFGGDTFRPILGFSGLMIGIVGLAVVTVLAVIYPVLVARKIRPLDAINRH